jgi:hypothetical protein
MNHADNLERNKKRVVNRLIQDRSGRGKPGKGLASLDASRNQSGVKKLDHCIGDFFAYALSFQGQAGPRCFTEYRVL